MTAVFLINRLPTPVLENKTLFELLTTKAPDYQALRTFGCLCYVPTSTQNRNKFQPKAKACVFLGYPSGYKGYKLLDMESNSISVFHEDFFPFLSSTLTEDTRPFFPHLPSSASIDDSLPFAQSSSDVSLHLEITSSESLLPLALDSRRHTK